MRARTARERVRSASCPPSESATLLSLEGSVSNGPLSGSNLSRRIRKLAAEAVTFLFHSMLGYALMLTVMVYNGYLFVAVVGGMGLGYFLFGHLSMKVNMENIQAHQTKMICTTRCLQQGECVAQKRGSKVTSLCQCSLGSRLGEGNRLTHFISL